jgi:alkanesulfonate monooxygenase SsuD/methylene tetrahydromethanopterin reductase-like flavin-dependent oxidoreductase (luciferase family)
MGERLPPGAGAAIGLDALRAECLAGTPEQVLDRAAAFAAIGVSELILSPGPVWFAMPDPSLLDLLAEAILPRLRDL